MHRRVALTAVCVASFLVANAAAFEISPFSFELGPSGRASTKVVRVSNPGKEPIAIEVVVNARQVTPAGQDVLGDAEGDIAVFPPQAMAPPGGAASFRVRYVGSPAIAQSKDYVVSFNQMALDAMGGGRSGVKVVMSFGAAVHVTPPGARADVRVVSVKRINASTLEITLENVGSKYARIGDAPWTFSCGPARIRLESEEVRALAPAPLILPGAQRIVRAPVQPACQAAPSVSLTLAER